MINYEHVPDLKTSLNAAHHRLGVAGFDLNLTLYSNQVSEAMISQT